MNSNNMLKFIVFSIIAGIILSVAAGIAFYSGIITNVNVLMWISFGISSFALALFPAGLSKDNFDSKKIRKCIEGFEMILSGAVSALILSITALSVTLDSASAGSTILVALNVFFVTLIISGIICVFVCFKKIFSERASGNCPSAASNSALSDFNCVK